MFCSGFYGVFRLRYEEAAPGISPDGRSWYPAVEYGSSDFENFPQNWCYLSLEEDPLLGGFYYYTVPVNPGERTVPLAEQILVSYEQDQPDSGF